MLSRLSQLVLCCCTIEKQQKIMTISQNRTIQHRNLSSRKKLMKLREAKCDNDQLICCLHGPAGCGKSTVIELVMEYARDYCSFLPHVTFTARTIVVTAMTGVAATIIQGEMTHGALYLNQQKELEPEQIELWEDTKLLIIDEISFASKHNFHMIHRNVSKLKQEFTKKYGGINIIFSGDFRLLELVGSNPIYEEDCPYFVHWVNCYIELNGMHRFRNDKHWGRLLMRMRDGKMTKEDIDFINTKIVNNKTKLLEDLRYATYFNRDQDAINTALFKERYKLLYNERGHTNDTITPSVSCLVHEFTRN